MIFSKKRERERASFQYLSGCSPNRLTNVQYLLLASVPKTETTNIMNGYFYINHNKFESNCLKLVRNCRLLAHWISCHLFTFLVEKFLASILVENLWNIIMWKHCEWQFNWCKFDWTHLCIIQSFPMFVRIVQLMSHGNNLNLKHCDLNSWKFSSKQNYSIESHKALKRRNMRAVIL